jgi:PAS domain S-box-containing protein
MMINRKGARGSGPGAFVAAAAALRNGIFGCMFVMSKKADTSVWRPRVEVTIRILQMIAFVVSSKVGVPWPAPMAPVESALNIWNTSFLQRWSSYSIFIALYYIAFSYLIVVALLFLYGTVCFIRNHFPSLVPLRFLRVLGIWSAGPLFIPLLQLVSELFVSSDCISEVDVSCDVQLMSAFQCNDPDANRFWSDSKAECSSRGMITLQALSLVLSFLLLLFALLFTSIFYESNQLSPSSAAKAHGRADMVLLITQVALVLVGQTFYRQLNTWIIIATAAIAGTMWMGAYVLWMPFYSHSMNTANICGATIYLWAVLCVVLNNYYPAGDAAITLYCGLPVAALAGYSISHARANYILSVPVTRLSSAYEVELRARYMLNTAIWGHALSTSPNSGWNPLASVVVVPSPAAASRTQEKGAHGASDAKGPEGAATGPSDSAADVDVSDDLEDRVITLRKRVSSQLLLEILAMYRSCGARFHSSSLLHVFCARYYAAFFGNRHMQFSHLSQAERRQPAMDVSYLVFAARKMAESHGGGAAMSALHRVTFEKYSADAKRYVQLAVHKQLAFWTELMDALPDLSRLHTLASETNEAVTAAEKSFAELFILHPQSLSTIRLYAAFNVHVTCNADKAFALSAEADRLEDMNSKEHNMEGVSRLQLLAESSLDIMAENTAIITLGASARNLGLISSANAAACKLFGYARLQLERRSAFTLLPADVGALHEESLRRYLNTGEGIIVDYNRVVFGLHKSGVLLPLLSSIRDAPADGGTPSFLWLIRELRTVGDYIMISDEDVVLGATQGGCSLMCIEPTSIHGGEVGITDFVPGWSNAITRNELQSAQGGLITFQQRKHGITSYGSGEDTSPRGYEKSFEQPRSLDPFDEVCVRGYLQRVAVERVSLWLLYCTRKTMTSGRATNSFVMGPRGQGGLQHSDSEYPVLQRVESDINIGDGELERIDSATQLTDVRNPVTIAAQAYAARAPVRLPDGAVDILHMLQLPGSTDNAHIGLDAHTSSTSNTTAANDQHGGTPRLVPPVANATAVVKVLHSHRPGPMEVASDDGNEDVSLLVDTAPGATTHTRTTTQPENVVTDGKQSLRNQTASPSSRSAAKWARPLTKQIDGTTVVRDDGERSTASSKSTHISKSMARMRRMLADSSKSLLPGLWWLRIVGFATTALAIALSITVALQARSSFLEYLDNLDFVALGARLMVLKANTIYSMQDIMFHSRSWVPLSEEDLALRRQYMAANATEFAYTHSKMFELVQGTDLAAAYAERYVPMTKFHMPPNGVNGFYT